MVLQLICIEFESDKTFVYQTTSDSKFYLKSTRKVQAISSTETMFLYEISFDKTIVKHALGISLPIFLIRMLA